MTSDALKTLFHPFETGLLDPPGQGASVLFLGAQPDFRLPGGFATRLHLVQGFRSSCRSLEAAGHAVIPTTPAGLFDTALVLVGRHRGENERRIADALAQTLPGALIVVAGGKEDGIASLRKRLGALMEIEGSEPKYHGVVFWLRRPADASAVAAILRAENPDSLVDGRFWTTPGMFSHDRIDAGSRLLAATLPADLKGKAADFCAGWGFLSVELANRCPGIASIDLYEADHASLEAARRNMEALAPSMPAGFFWRDLAAEKVERRYDVIVMNPPFHAGRAAEPELGQAIIRAAAAALKPGGRLLMVANKGLPYERVLAASFASVAEIAVDRGFGVFSAKR